MANPIDRFFIKLGVTTWNVWRKILPQRSPDLSQVILSGAILRRANLSRTNLSEAYLFRANLKKTNLSEADLRYAELQEAHLEDANLQGANLQEAVLWQADLRGTDLQKANLDKAILTRADLQGANLSGANLSQAYLAGARLIQTNLTDANITGTYLYGTARDDWQIKGIVCEYVYWDDNPRFESDDREKEWEATHRMPKDRDFRPGEFEDLYRSLPTFEYYFEHGFTPLDAVVMDQVVQGINERHPEFSLRLKNFEAAGIPHATLTVIHQDHLDLARTQVSTDYEARLAALEGKQELILKLMSKLASEKYSITADGDIIIQAQRSITTGRDYHERIGGEAQVTTGSSSHEKAPQQEN